MPFTNQQVYEIQIVIAKRLVVVNELLLSTINKQHSMEKFLSVAIPNLAPEFRARIQGSVGGSETAMEHLEAASDHFAEMVEEFASLK